MLLSVAAADAVALPQSLEAALPSVKHRLLLLSRYIRRLLL
jgi:hypothetical protein